MNKKGVGILAFFLFATLFLSFLASAETPGEGIVKITNDLFTPVIKAVFQNTNQLTEQFLLALIIFALCYLAMSRIPMLNQSTLAVWIISLAIPILAIRYIINQDLINLVLLPQGVFGVAALVMAPFAIWFWCFEIAFEGPQYHTLRKIAWAVFAAVYIVLWFNAMYPSEATAVKNTFVASSDAMYASPPSLGNFGYIYLLAAIIAIIIFALDGTIQRALAKGKVSSASSAIHRQRATDLENWGYKMDAAYGMDTINYVGQTPGNNFKGPKAHDKDKKYIRDQVVALRTSV